MSGSPLSSCLEISKVLVAFVEKTFVRQAPPEKNLSRTVLLTEKLAIKRMGNRVDLIVKINRLEYVF